MRANACPELDPLENFASRPTRCIVCPLDANISAEACHATRCLRFLSLFNSLSLRSSVSFFFYLPPLRLRFPKAPRRPIPPPTRLRCRPLPTPPPCLSARPSHPHIL